MRAPDPIDPRAHRLLAGASRVRVLEFLRGLDGPATAPEVAERVGLHPNTVRLHLDQLADAGLVSRRREPRGGPGRPRILYAAVAVPARPEADDEEGYRLLAGVLAGQLEAAVPDVASGAVEAGRAWARSLAPDGGAEPVISAEAATEHLVGLMDRLGFQPAVGSARGAVELHRCPFHQVAERHPRVVCGVHLGLMQGALEGVDAPLRATRLDPFVTPDLCLAHLGPLEADDDTPARP